MSLPETHHSLIVRLGRADDEPAWQSFVATYEPFLMNLVSRQGVPTRHVADATQILLLAIARSVEQWSPDGKPASFRRWLATVSRNVVIRFMQQESRQITGDGGSEFLEQLRHHASLPDSDQIDQYRHELIVWAADRVRSEFIETSWNAFQQTTVEGRSVNDVAAELNVSPGSIYMSRSRIMARIRKLVHELTE
jgi:RNA polymerase sigma factor (sigma-70 family)